MHKFYIFLSKLFTAIFAILFVITSTLVLILFGPYRFLSSSSLYKKAFSDLDVYGKIPAIASNFLPSSILINPCGEEPDTCVNIPAENRLPSYFANLTPEDWQTLLEIFLPSAGIQTMTESALDGLFAFLDGNIDQMRVSMGVLKNNLKGTAEEDALHLFFASLPPCNEAETAELSVPNPTSVIVPLCKPADELLNPLISNLRQQLGLYINKIPDGIVISLPTTARKEIRRGLDFLAWIPVLPLPFLLGVTLLGVRSLKNGLRMWGILLFISSMLALGIGLTFRFGTKVALDLVLGFQNISFLTPNLINLIRQFEEYLLDHLTDWIIYPALILFSIGLVVWIISALFQKKDNGSANLPPDTHTEAL